MQKGHFSDSDMRAYLDAQAQKLALLEAEIQSLKEREAQYADKAPVHIEKIEYKFDQLKIERLEGTLNIGLNPANAGEMDEFTIQNQPFPPASHNGARTSQEDEITKAVTFFIQNELSSLITETERQLGIQLNDDYHPFIRDDLYKQLKSRVDYYLNQYPYDSKRETETHYRERIIEHIKTDIMQAVRAFLQNADSGMKGR